MSFQRHGFPENQHILMWANYEQEKNTHTRKTTSGTVLWLRMFSSRTTVFLNLLLFLYIHLYSPHNVVAQLHKQTKTSKKKTNEKERIIMTAPLCTYKLSNLQYQLQILNHLAFAWFLYLMLNFSARLIRSTLGRLKEKYDWQDLTILISPVRNNFIKKPIHGKIQII